MTVALIPGSFDPPTNGHLDVIERCARLFDEVVVAVIKNPSKKPLFTEVERIELLVTVTSRWDNVTIGAFGGLLVDYAEERIRETHIDRMPWTWTCSVVGFTLLAASWWPRGSRKDSPSEEDPVLQAR